MRFTRVLDCRKNIAFSKSDKWITFIVFEIGIEIRRILFDKIAL